MAAQWMAQAIEATIPAQSARDERTATAESALPDGTKRIVYAPQSKKSLKLCVVHSWHCEWLKFSWRVSPGRKRC